MQEFWSILVKVNIPVLLCINKIDKASTVEKILPFLESLGEKFQADEVFPISAFDRSDVKKLRNLILKYLPEQEAIYDEDYITDRSQKFVISEFIREKLMRNLSNELPYDITVEIEKFELDGKLYRIAARIFVDKASQKSIVIGQMEVCLRKLVRNQDNQSRVF